MRKQTTLSHYRVQINSSIFRKIIISIKTYMLLLFFLGWYNHLLILQQRCNLNICYWRMLLKNDWIFFLTTTQRSRPRRLVFSTNLTTDQNIKRLRSKIPGSLISRNGDINWLRKSYSLTPLDYFVWDCLKREVYDCKQITITALKNHFRRAINETNYDSQSLKIIMFLRL